MSTTVRIKPAGHNMVRNPDAAMRHLDPAGELVEMNSYWHRRITDGDVKVIDESEPEGTKEKK